MSSQTDIATKGIESEIQGKDFYFRLFHLRLRHDLLHRMKMKLPTAKELARRFDEILRTHVSKEEYGKILRLNLTEEYEGSCASHEYCDANMTMLEAMKSFGIPEDMTVEDDQCHRLWNLAWEKWKSNG